MPTKKTAAAVAATAPTPRDTVASVGRWLGLVAITSAVGVVVAGAFAADLVGGDARAAAVVAVIVGLLVPVGVAVAAARGRPVPWTRAARVTFGLQLVLLLVGVGFFAGPTANALRAHGHWPSMVVGNEELGRALAVSVADLLAPAAPLASTAPTTTTTLPPLPTTTTLPTTTALAAPSTPKEVFVARAPSVVVVQVRSAVDKDNPLAAIVGITESEGHGSGFVVDGGVVVTNHHVIAGATSARLRFQDGRVFDAVHVLYDDPVNDLAILGVDGDIGAVPIAIAADSAAVGDSVVVIGSPLGLDYSLSSGLVAARREQEGTHLLQIDATIAPGSSGGPVFDGHGNLIGVSVATRGAGLNFAVDASHVRAALAAARTDTALTKWAGSFQLTSFDVEGEAPGPTTRGNLLSVLAQMQSTSESCVVGRPAGELVLTMRKGDAKTGEAARANFTTSAVTTKQAACLDGLPRQLTFIVNMLLSSDSAKPTKITARYAADDGRVTVFELVR